MSYKVIIGLGNPGKRYEWTRHNLGWLALDELQKKLDADARWKQHPKAKAEFCELHVNGEKLTLLKPLTFMNDSGRAIRQFLDYHQLSANDFILLYDDVDMELGKLRITEQGGSGGHNGVKSVISHVKTDQFTRIKLGVKNKKKDRIPTDKFVLQPFGLFEKPKVKKWLPVIAQATECLLTNQISQCKNTFH